MRNGILALVAASLVAVAVSDGRAARLILPQERKAYYSDEPIELAVAGLATGAAAVLELVPTAASAPPVTLSVKGDGSTVTLVLPARALAPGAYVVKLDGREAAKLTIASGVGASTCLVSQTIGWERLEAAGANFILGNAFSFGRLSDGRPKTTDLRASRSAGFSAFDRAIAMDLPTVVYMYWTGYVTHKPFGSEKSWASANVSCWPPWQRVVLCNQLASSFNPAAV